MTPLSLLAEARALGVVLVPEPPDTIRLRGQTKALPPKLRERLRAVKPELLALLTEADARRRAIADAWAGAYRRVRLAAGAAWPTGGLDTLRRRRPGLLSELAWAEAAAERVAVAFRDGGADADAARAAVAAWEALAIEGAVVLGGCCHDCGREAVAAMVDPVDGSRFCGRCVR